MTKRLLILVCLAWMLIVLAACRTEVSPLGQPPGPTTTPLPTQTPRPTLRPTATRPPLATTTPIVVHSQPGFYVISNPDGANLPAPQFPVAGDLFLPALGIGRAAPG